MRYINNNEGFTLVEVLIAMVITSIASLGIATLTVAIIQGNSFSNKLTTATVLAQDRMEEIKRIGFKNAESASTTEGYGQIANYISYKRITSITNEPPVAGFKTATVKVLWGSDKHSVTLKSVLTE